MYQFLRTKSPAVFAMTSPATKPCHEDAISTMPKPDSLAAAVDLVPAPAITMSITSIACRDIALHGRLYSGRYRNRNRGQCLDK